jgi:ABC-type glutathione transport system ATPase component
MCISRLIKGIPLATAQEEVMATMQELKLEPGIFYKKTTQLSGGQRQRVAFVRAITAEFEVLFGDEPTGNLDKDTAFRLMAFLKNNLQRHQRTAIIVSHDLDLALHFADQIVLMTFCGENGSQHGIILPENSLAKKDGQWQDTKGQALKSPASYVANKLGINPFHLSETI